MTREMVKRAVYAYLREHIGMAAAYVMLVALFYLLAGLYGYEHSMQYMSYAVFLALFFGLCAALLGFVRELYHLSALMQAKENEEERECYLPTARTLSEQIYQEILCESEQKRRSLLSEYDEKEKEMADYYTMWTHQIKTPIAAMRLLLQEREDTFSKEQQEELFKIEQYAKMALQYARLQNMSSDLVLKRYDICQIVRQAVKCYSILFIGSGLSFAMEDFTCYAVTDEKWLSFVTEQLLSNALKYTRSGGITISGDAHTLVIEDTGIGISESDLPRVFERGFTGYNGRIDKKSTGIGLYLCQQILRRLGHTIAITSKMGVGTRVTLGFCQTEQHDM